MPSTSERFDHARLDDGAPSWIWIEEEYRLGQLSVRNIARAAGMSDTGIRYRAKKEGWERDLTEDVRKKVRTSQALRTDDEALSNEEIVEHAAKRVLTTLGEHRDLIKDARGFVTGMMTDLVKIAPKRMKQKGREQVIIFDAQARIIGRLAGAIAKLINLERQALGFDDQEREPERPLDFIPLAERIKHYTRIDNGEGAKVVPITGGNGAG